MTARKAALEILIRVMHHGAYANLCIKETAPKLENDRDRAFCSALVYGVLEHRVYLTWVLSELCQMKKLPEDVIEALYLGAYQILFLDSIPDSAAVSESVNLIRKKFNRLTGVVNGVLRNVARGGHKDPEDKKLALGCALNLPAELTEKWIGVFGGAVPAPSRRRVGVRVRRAEDTEAVRRALEDAGAQIESPFDGCFTVTDAGDLTRLAEYKKGLFVIQSASSQLIARAVGAECGMRVLDACAAPGGKSFAMADGMGNTGEIVAMDIHSHRVDLIEKSAKRLDLSSVKAVCGDASALGPDLGLFDRVLVDAPCSGLSADGKPEIPLRVTGKEIEEIAALQKKILKSAADRVKDGGVLLYSTCTWTKEEDEDQVAAFLAERDDFSAGHLTAYVPQELRPFVVDDTMLRLDRTRDKMPPFFLARLQKKG